MTEPFRIGEGTLLSRMGIVRNSAEENMLEAARLKMRDTAIRIGSTWAPTIFNASNEVEKNDSAPASNVLPTTTGNPDTDKAIADGRGVLNPDGSYTETTTKSSDLGSVVSDIGANLVGYFSRGVIIVLGFIFVAVGLGLFGRGTVVNAVVQLPVKGLTGK